MHDGAEVISHVVVANFGNNAKVGDITLPDVVSVDVHVIVPVRPALLVEEAQRVTDLMHYNAHLWSVGPVGHSISKLLVAKITDSQNYRFFKPQVPKDYLP